MPEGDTPPARYWLEPSDFVPDARLLTVEQREDGSTILDVEFRGRRLRLLTFDLKWLGAPQPGSRISILVDAEGIASVACARGAP